MGLGAIVLAAARFGDEIAWYENLSNPPAPKIGDANGDGIFDSSDLVAVFQAGEYEDGIPHNSTFEEGDGVIYCIEPLASDQTPLINTLEEAAAMVTAIGSRSVRTMLDCSAAGRMETAPLPALVDKWLPNGMLAHVQLNDRNRRGPGQGEQRFAPLFAALTRHGYAGDIAVEPFDYVPDGPGAAARAIGYVRGILEALQQA